MNPRLPALTSRDVIRALESAGFFVRRTRGSHYLFKHPRDPRLHVVVPYHSRDLSRKTLLSIIKSAGLTEEEFLELL